MIGANQSRSTSTLYFLPLPPRLRRCRQQFFGGGSAKSVVESVPIGNLTGVAPAPGEEPAFRANRQPLVAAMADDLHGSDLAPARLAVLEFEARPAQREGTETDCFSLFDPVQGPGQQDFIDLLINGQAEFAHFGEAVP